MKNVTLDRAVEIAKALTPKEQLQLGAMIDSWQAEAPAEATPEQERRFAEHLLAQGVLSHLPTGYPEGYVDPPPIIVHGEPVSETIIRERRRPDVPVFAAEVRSENDYGPGAEQDMPAKRADYFAAGCQVVWDVDLLSEDVVRAYRAGDPDSPTIYRRGETAEAQPAVPGRTMPVDDLFE